MSAAEVSLPATSADVEVLVSVLSRREEALPAVLTLHVPRASDGAPVTQALSRDLAWAAVRGLGITEKLPRHLVAHAWDLRRRLHAALSAPP